MESLLRRVLPRYDSLSPVGGGDINQTYSIRTPERIYFAKYNPDCNNDFFQKEKEGLDFLTSYSSFRIPKVYSWVHEDHEGLLLMEFIPTGDKNISYYYNLGKKLAEMHLRKGSHFGLHYDNYVGNLPQQNTPTSDVWAEFYVRNRLLPFHDLLPLPKNFNQISEHIIHFIHEKTHHIFPSPLHGDLWHGNHLNDTQQQPVLIDPAVYFGDRTIDLAMLQLFGSPPRDFFKAYFSVFPPDQNWNFRMELSSLYPVLVHARLFGGHYRDRAASVFKVLFKNIL